MSLVWLIPEINHNWEDYLVFYLLTSSFLILVVFISMWVLHLAFIKYRYEKEELKVIDNKDYDIPKGANKESENTLIIVDTDPETIFGKVEKIDTIFEHPLNKSKKVKIEDEIYDTDDLSLLKKKFILRYRKIDKEKLITFKGPSDEQNGSSDRMEWEKKYNQYNLNILLEKLQDRKLTKCKKEEIKINGSTVEEVMEELGFEKQFVRTTKRETISVKDGKEQKEMAEIALDRVKFHLKNKKIQHFEIEIEKKKGTDLLVEYVTRYLLDHINEKPCWFAEKLGKKEKGYLWKWSISKTHMHRILQEMDSEKEEINKKLKREDYLKIRKRKLV
jgi:hypothetical protein